MIPMRDFVLAGNAVFTLTNPDGQHYTYKINKAKPNKAWPGTTWWVLLGISYDGGVNLGRLNLRQDESELSKIIFTPGKQWNVRDPAPSMKTFLDWLAPVLMGVEDDTIRFQHEGRCCVCSRPLTNPESIDAGIGPECAGRM